MNSGGTVTPVGLTTRRAGKPIQVGANPQAIAITPDGRTAYVANSGSDTVTPIDTATRRAGAPIPVGTRARGRSPSRPDGADRLRGQLAARTPSRRSTPHPAARAPRSRSGAQPRTLIAITPDGRPPTCSTGAAPRSRRSTPPPTAALAPIPVGQLPVAIAIAPDGRTAYVANYGSNTVTPITIATGTRGPGHPGRPGARRARRDARRRDRGGRRRRLRHGDPDRRRPRARRPAIPVGYSPDRDRHGGRHGVRGEHDLRHGDAGQHRDRARRPAIRPGSTPTRPPSRSRPGGATAVVIGTYAGTVRLINTRTRTASTPIKVGAYPVAAAIAR